MSVATHAARLRSLATHFELQDWNYTRDKGGLSAIRYDRPEDRLPGRVKAAARWLIERQPEWAKGWGPNRFAMALFSLHRTKHLPDGVLDGGNIITFWEETGEYLQCVQPSIGALLADLMDAHPELPEVRAIADEMSRITAQHDGV